MFITTSCRLRVLNVLLILALLSQLLSGCPSQVLELWCLEPPQPCYRTVVRSWRRPLREAPFQYKLAWLIHWLARTLRQAQGNAWPRWLLRCGLLLTLLLWKRAVCPPFAWGLLAEPLVEVLCLGLGLVCRSSRWRRRWWSLARWLDRGYSWAVLLLLVIPPSVQHIPLLLMGGVLVPNHQERTGSPQLGVDTAEEARLGWLVPCQVTVLVGEVLFCGGGPDAGWIQLAQDEETVYLLMQGRVVLEVPRSDHTGLRWLVSLLVRKEWMSLAEAADLLGLSLRTVQRD